MMMLPRMTLSITKVAPTISVIGVIFMEIWGF